MVFWIRILKFYFVYFLHIWYSRHQTQSYISRVTKEEQSDVDTTKQRESSSAIHARRGLNALMEIQNRRTRTYARGRSRTIRNLLPTLGLRIIRHKNRGTKTCCSSSNHSARRKSKFRRVWSDIHDFGKMFKAVSALISQDARRSWTSPASSAWRRARRCAARCSLARTRARTACTEARSGRRGSSQSSSGCRCSRRRRGWGGASTRRIPLAMGRTPTMNE